MTNEAPHIPVEEMKYKMALQVLVMKYAQDHKQIDPLDWADSEGKNYSKYFRQIWDSGDIAERYHDALDQHPGNLDALVEWIQDEIEKMAAADKEKAQ